MKKFYRGIVVCACLLMSCRSGPLISEKDLIGFKCDDPVLFELRVSNQSRDLRLVDISVTIDKKLVFDDNFATEDFHNWKRIRFLLCAGKHHLEAKSKTGGASILEQFTVSSNQDCGILNYWFSKEMKQPRKLKFDVFKNDQRDVR